MRLSLIILLIILFLAAFLRMEGVFTNSFAFTYDVGRDLLAVQNVLFTGKIPLIGQTTGLAGLFYGPWWYYILIPVFFLSSGNPAGIALFIALTGVVTVYIGYVLGKYIEGASYGLLFAGFLAFSPVMIGITTQIWNPNIAPLYVIIFFFCFYKIIDFLDKKKNISIYWFIFLGVLLGLLLDSEIVFGSLFISGVLLSLIFLFKEKLFIKHYSYVAVGFLLILLPRVIFELRHNFLMTKSIFLVISNSLSHQAGNGISFKPLIAFSTLENLWNDTFARGNYLLGTSLILYTCFGIIFFYKKIGKKEKCLLQITLFILFSFFLGLCFFPGDVWSHYTIGIPVLYIFIFSLILYKTVLYFKKFKTFIVALIFILLVIEINPPQIIENIKNPFWQGDVSLYRNQLGVVDFIYKYAQGKNFNYIVYTPPVHDYTYRYIFSWYGKNTYGYIPSEKKDRLFFLIMEPDNQYPNRLEAWLTVRENDGKIIENIKLPGEINVQIRAH